jgi:cytochrome c2
MPEIDRDLGSETDKRPSWRYLTAWYAVSLCLLCIFPLWKFELPVWRLPGQLWLPFAGLTGAFVLSAMIAAVLRPSTRWRDFALTTVFTTAIFGLVFLAFALARIDYPRTIIVAAFACAVLLVPAPYLAGRVRYGGIAAFVVLIGALAGGFTAVRATYQAPPAYSASLIKTEYYNLAASTFSDAFPDSVVHGGALARIDDRYLLLTGDGHLHVFNWEPGTDALKVTPLPYRVPINGDEFAVAAGLPWAKQPDPLHEGAHAEVERETLNTGWFRTYGLLVQETGNETRVFVSHDYWNAAKDCWVERVSMLKSDRTSFLSGTSGAAWTTLFETTPCLPVHGEHRRHSVPFAGYFGGGRMALLDDKTVLLTVGEFGFDGVLSIDIPSQDRSASYGKTIAINITDGQATLFTLGHRNPQGLYIDKSGTIWSTEHGPQGGDELNILVRGENYGWPYATDGTDYGSFSWPLNKPESEQQDYQAPIFAWVPSIAVSNLIRIDNTLFSKWRGDLLIGSLKAQTLFRAHMRNGHVAYLESIFIGGGIRDLIEGYDGRVILWTDDNKMISLSPKDANTGEALFAEKCSGCHETKRNGARSIGPNLLGVAGRQVASLANYPAYSTNLRRLGGRWTDERLDAFLTDPGTLCPGTTMDFRGDANTAERTAIVGYLHALR